MYVCFLQTDADNVSGSHSQLWGNVRNSDFWNWSSRGQWSPVVTYLGHCRACSQTNVFGWKQVRYFLLETIYLKLKVVYILVVCYLLIYLGLGKPFYRNGGSKLGSMYYTLNTLGECRLLTLCGNLILAWCILKRGKTRFTLCMLFIHAPMQ